jgi:tetratricopeptide (TPR) repeat protein
LKARAHWRLAFCYEKTGNFITAEQLYGQMLSEYGNMPAVTRMVHAQIREQLRRKQIKELKQQLQTLTEFSPALRAQLEEEIKKLQEKLQTLEKMKPGEIGKMETVGEVKDNTKELTKSAESKETSATAQTTNKDREENGKGEQQRMSEILALHLYHIARNLYSQGFFVSARENLRKALSFNPQNQQASELLKDVEAMLSHRDMPSLIRKAVDQNVSKPDGKIIASPDKLADTILSKDTPSEASFSEVAYATEPLIKLWNLEAASGRDNGWIEVMTRLIKSQASEPAWLFPAALRYENGKFFVKQTPLIQERIKNMWDALPEAKDVITIDAVMLLLPESYVDILWRQPKSIFYLAEEGISYTFLTLEQYRQLQKTDGQNTSQEVCRFPENFLLTDQKVVWKHWQEMPMAQGYQGANLNFKFYAEGVQMQCQRDSKNKQMEIALSAQKMERPVGLVLTPQGPVEHPYVLEQQSNVPLSAERPQHVLIRGVLNPWYRQVEKDEELIILMRSLPLSWPDFLQQKTVPAIPRELQSKDYSLRYYDIKPWQNVYDSVEDSRHWGDENNRHFLQRFLLEECKEQTLPMPFKVFDSYLVAYGSPAVHQTVETFLQALKSSSDVLCSLSIYLLSLERYTWQQLLKKWQLQPPKDTVFRVYAIPLQKEEMMHELQSVENIKFHHTLGPVIVGNTQKVVLRDCQMRSYMEGIVRQDNGLVQSKMADIAEGVVVEARPVIISEQRGICELAVTISQSKGARDMTYAAAPQFNVSCKVPEMQIQKGYLHMPFYKGNCYLMAGFQYGEMAPSRDFVFLLFLNIFKNKEDTNPVLPSKK